MIRKIREVLPCPSQLTILLNQKSASPSCTYQYLYCDNRHRDRASEGSTLAEVPCPLAGAGADGGIAAPSLAAASIIWSWSRGPTRPRGRLHVRTTDGCALKNRSGVACLLVAPRCDVKTMRAAYDEDDDMTI